jgi:tight adherence protein C
VLGTPAVIAVALSFLAAVLVAAGLATAWPADRAGFLERRRNRATGRRGGAGRTARTARLLHALALVGRRLAPLARVAAPHELEARIAAAGLAGPGRGALASLDARELMAAKLAAALLAALGGGLLGAIAPGRLGVALTVAGPIAGFLAPDLWLVRRARRRARELQRELPGMLDLLRVTVEAGLPLTAALTAVGERSTGALGAEWRVVGREVALGVPLLASLRAVARRAPVPEVAALIAALERAIRHGAPPGETLVAQAREARAARGRRIREEAAKAGPKIQLVVALLLVPSVLLMVAAALAAAFIDGQGSLLIA